MARHRKLTQKFAGFPMFKLGTNRFTYPFTHSFTKDFVGLDGLSLDLQFATDKTLTARKGPTPTFTRASTATFVGINGLIQSAVINAARFDHDPVTLACKGLLIEESRTNLLSRSAEFNETVWLKLRSSISANSTTSPSGDGSADKLIEDSSAGTHMTYRTINTGSLVAHTFSVFAKADGRNFVYLDCGDGFPLNSNAYFNLSNGTLGNIGANATASITAFGNGWYRCSVTATPTSTTTNGFYILTASTNGVTSYQGDGTSGIFIWGAQVEAGSFPTSYIPTTTASVVRSADVCSITGSDFTGFYNNDQGTMVTVASANGFTSNNNAMASIESGATNVMRVLYRAAQVNRLTAQVAAAVATPASNYNTVNVVYKAAITADITGADYVIDGTQIPDTFTGSALTANNLKFTGISSATSNTTISSFRYYKKRLPVSKLQTLTT